MMLSVSQTIQHGMIGKWVNNELERMWKNSQWCGQYSNWAAPKCKAKVELLWPTCSLSSNKAINNSIHLLILLFWGFSLWSPFCYLQTSYKLFSCICLFMPVVLPPLPDPGISSPQLFFHAMTVLSILSPPMYTTRAYIWIWIIKSAVCQDIL
jgi:hypothetical protein